MSTPVVGLIFVHSRRLDPYWKPGPGEKYADAPHELYRVTRVAQGTVWYRALGSAKTRDFCTLERFSEKVLRVVEA